MTYAEANPFYQMIEGPAAHGCRLFDVYNKRNSYCCLLIQSAKEGGLWKLYWDSEAGRGSKRRFASAQAALEFMHQRRVKRQQKALAA